MELGQIILIITSHTIQTILEFFTIFPIYYLYYYFSFHKNYLLSTLLTFYLFLPYFAKVVIFPDMSCLFYPDSAHSIAVAAKKVIEQRFDVDRSVKKYIEFWATSLKVKGLL